MAQHARCTLLVVAAIAVLGHAVGAKAAEPRPAAESEALLAADPEGALEARAWPVLPRAGARADSAAALRPSPAAAFDTTAATGFVDYLWVLRGSLASPASVDSVLARARRMGVRGLLVQVVGRGDACYRSDILPRAEFIDRAAGPGFDPFGVLLARAHDQGLEVHAWMNCLLVWSAPQPPRDPRHVLNAHPEWIAEMRGGRRMTAMGARERELRQVEGVFLSAAHPGVRAWLGSVAREIAERYPVDGIHLDYIRDPSVDVGWDPTTRARFALETGVDPEHMDHLTPAERARVSEAWAQFQRDQVTAIVRTVRDSVLAARPGVQISAAVVADTVRAERSNSQMWRDWVRDGLLDRAFLMCYAAPVQTVMSQLLRFAVELGPGRIVPGIAMFNTAPLTAALKIKGARELGYTRVALYSYDSLFDDRSYLAALLGQFHAGAPENR